MEHRQRHQWGTAVGTVSQDLLCPLFIVEQEAELVVNHCLGEGLAPWQPRGPDSKVPGIGRRHGDMEWVRCRCLGKLWDAAGLTTRGLENLISLFPGVESVTEGAWQGEDWALLSKQALHSKDHVACGCQICCASAATRKSVCVCGPS